MKLRGTRSLAGKRRRTVPGLGEKGQVLIELLISIAIFGVISVGFLSALVAGYHGVIVAHDQTMAESLTRTAFENVRTAPYPLSTVSDNVTAVMQYDVVIHADNVTRSTNELTSPPETTYTETDDASDLQMVTVTIRSHETGKVLVVTQNLKERL